MSTAQTAHHAPAGVAPPSAPRIVVGPSQIVRLALLAIAAGVAIYFYEGAAPVVAAAIVAALVPKQHGWNVRAPIAITAGLLALFVVRAWPGAAVATEAAAPVSESGHLLSWVVWMPLVGAIAVLFVPRQSHATLRWTTLLVMAATLALSLPLMRVQMGRTYHFNEDVAWLPRFGIQYHLAIDGITLWLVLLTTFITPLAAYASFGPIRTRIKDWCFALLLLEGGMLGAFVSLDLFLFYVFWELMLVPMYVMIGVWGGTNRIYSTVKFFLFTMFGSMLMLGAILYMAYAYAKATGGAPSFDYFELQRLMLPRHVQLWLWAAFTLAFIIKVPMFPVHTWLPDAHTEAPTAGSIILAAVMLKMGTYGYVCASRMGLFPEASAEWAPNLAGVAVLGGGSSTAPSAPGSRTDVKRSHRVLVGRACGVRDARPFRDDDGLDRGRRPADGQPWHLDRPALPPLRRHLRPSPHAQHRRIRRSGNGRCPCTPRSSSSRRSQASACRRRTGSSASCMVITGAFGVEQARELRGRAGDGRGDRRHPGGGVHADGRPEGVLRPDHEEGERARAGHEPARDRRRGAARDDADLRHSGLFPNIFLTQIRVVRRSAPSRRTSTPGSTGTVSGPKYYEGPIKLTIARRPEAPPQAVQPATDGGIRRRGTLTAPAPLRRRTHLLLEDAWVWLSLLSPLLRRQHRRAPPHAGRGLLGPAHERPGHGHRGRALRRAAAPPARVWMVGVDQFAGRCGRRLRPGSSSTASRSFSTCCFVSGGRLPRCSRGRLPARARRSSGASSTRS